jgi:benzoyl-CoA reductase/2-hydroxyglutaryl-CoA dehydratase subunit BcrC/BadD/HgdB
MNFKNQQEYLAYNRDAVSYSPALQKLNDLAVYGIDDLTAEAKKGKNVVWSGTASTKSAFVYACGASPLSIADFGRFKDEGAIELAEDFFQIPEEACSQMKTALGEFYMHRDDTVKRVVHNARGCEPFNQVFEYLKDFDYDVFTLDMGYLPKHDSERSVQYRKHYEEEYRRLAKWISGKPLDEQKLWEEMKCVNRIMRKIRTVLNLRKLHPDYMKSLSTILMFLGSDHFYGKKEEYEEMLDMLIEEMSALKLGDFHDSKIYLIWTGGRSVEYGIFQSIEESGGAILGWGVSNDLETNYDLNKEPMEAFMDSLLGDKNATGSSEDICKVLERQIEEFEAKGLIMYGFMGCSFSSVGRELMREYFKKREFPVLSLLGTYKAGEPSGQVITRVKAFMEMIAS